MPPELENDAEIDEVVGVTDEADASTEAEQSADAASSTAEDANEAGGPDSLSIVRDVVDGKTKEPTAASSATGAGQQDADSDTTKGQDDENFSDVPFHKHPRFQQVLGRLKTAEVDATHYRNVAQFIEEQGLSGQETKDLLIIGGLMKTNPAEAWRLMKPTVEKVLIAAGEVLPADLKAAVEAGELTRDAAIQVSRSRAEVSSVRARQEFDQQRAQTRQQAEAQNAINTAVSSWETDRKQRDPNFEAKLPALEREIAWLKAKEGTPTTPDGVRALLQKAYTAVNTAFVPSAPPRQQKREIRPVTGGQVNGSVRPEINSSMDAVQAVLARRAG